MELDGGNEFDMEMLYAIRIDGSWKVQRYLWILLVIGWRLSSGWSGVAVLKKNVENFGHIFLSFFFSPVNGVKGTK